MNMQEMDKQQLQQLKGELEQAYAAFKARGLKLNMSRGKPSAEQLDLSAALLQPLSDFKDADGVDVRNYGGLTGIPEARRLFGELMDMPAEQVIIGGTASLNLMYDTIARAFLHGVLPGKTPWGKLDKVKFLCPAPGYDRHFAICESFGIEMLPIAMTAEGPDMDAVEKLAASDSAIKGMWCVPMYSNPDGITYSEAVVKRIAALKPAADDFRIMWDNAYGVHHLDANDRDHLANIYTACAAAGNEDMVYMYASTSKITFAGGGISAMAASPANIAYTVKQLGVQTISYDKVNQLRHCRFLPDKAAVDKHMARHAAVLKPRFDIVLQALAQQIAPLRIGEWHQPKGGYFVSYYALPGTARRIVELCKQGGVELTGAGAAYPYKNDPDDSNIRIAPSYPSVDELKQAMELFCIACKLAAAEKLLG
ncbi:MAG: aminotransferase class I/II-fold pyridoxal phosphate-dependent enzyme [Bacillota bacterium]|nr:aminotransferase class I/II-fold pyridoxal phosphate-dependent enzyme [Bacillota bacterium]